MVGCIASLSLFLLSSAASCTSSTQTHYSSLRDSPASPQIDMVYCDYCERYFGSVHALRQHINTSSVHECIVCDYHFLDAEDRDWHLLDCHEYCESCNEWAADLHAHNLSYHRERYCADCRRTFIGLSQYNSVSCCFGAFLQFTSIVDGSFLG